MKRLILKRKRLGITDYRKRLALLKSGKPRLVVRKTNANIVVQVVKYSPEGDRVVATADVRSLMKLGWRAGANTPAAYLVGYLAGKLARERKVREAVLDIGRHRVSSRLFAALKGAVDAGLKVPHSQDVLPDEARIRGEHIDAHMAGAKGHQFAKYKESKLSVVKEFEKVLSKVKGE